MTLSMRVGRMADGILLLLNKPWMQYVWLLLITLLATALRFYQLGVWSFWIDEIYTVNHATSHFSSLNLLLQNIPPQRNWIPVSVILTAQALNTLGVSEWSARIASVLIGILSIPVLYFPTRKIFGERVALVAVLLLAVAPWHLFWSQNARFYTSLMLFYTLALFAFYFGIEEDKPGHLGLFLVFVYLAASERLIALFIFPVVMLYLVALWVLKFEKPKGVNLRNLAILSLPLLLGIVVEIYSWLVQGGSRFFGDFNWFTQYQIDDPFRLLLFIGNNMGVPLMVMGFFSGLVLIGKRSQPGLLMIVSALVPLVMLVILNLFIFTKDRYMFITLYSWILLTVLGIAEIASSLKGNQRWLLLGIFFVFFVSAGNDLLLYYKANQGDRLPWKSAFSLVETQAGDQDVIVAYWPEFGPYYTGRELSSYADLDLDTMLKSGKRYWFVLDSETIWLNGKVKPWLEDHAELKNVWYLRRPEDNYLKVYLFDPVRDTSQ
jgi:4-amino-4-deoxy-L-arabinose transferase-like glycosyltransferase